MRSLLSVVFRVSSGQNILPCPSVVTRRDLRQVGNDKIDATSKAEVSSESKPPTSFHRYTGLLPPSPPGVLCPERWFTRAPVQPVYVYTCVGLFTQVGRQGLRRFTCAKAARVAQERRVLLSSCRRVLRIAFRGYDTTCKYVFSPPPLSPPYRIYRLENDAGKAGPIVVTFTRCVYCPRSASGG